MRAVLRLIVLALVVTGVAGRASAALPTAIDDGGAQPGHAAVDPGPEAPAAQAPEPKHSSGGGDAEPAPAPPPPAPPAGGEEETKRGPRHRIALTLRFARRLGDAGQAIPPASGFGLAGTYEFRYAPIGPAIEAAFGVDFSFDRFATGEQGSCAGRFSGRQECISGTAQTFSATRLISETSFVLLHTFAARTGPVRPYLTLGIGLGIGYFSSVQPDLQPGNATDTHALGRVTVGIDVTLGRMWSATLRADYTAVHGVSPFVTDGGRTLPLFGDLFDVGGGVAYSF